MDEKAIEQELARAVKAAGGLALKLVCPGFDGMPDRIVLLPGGHAGFVEVKKPGLKPRPLQKARIKMLLEMGFDAYLLDDPETIPAILSLIDRR